METKTNIKTKIEKDPKCVIFSKSRRFEDIKYDTEARVGGVATKSKIQKLSSISASAASAESAESAKSAKSTFINNIYKVRKSESGSQLPAF